MKKDSKIYIAGHTGLVGSSFLRRLESDGYSNLVYFTSKELNLEIQPAVEDFFKREKPEYVILAAAKVGGIHANDSYPAEFIYNNLMIQSNVFDQAFRNNVKGLLFLGSSCIYPKMAPQPIKEEYLMTGQLEPTNAAYAMAKIAGVEMCWAYNRQYGTFFVPVMPNNLYGPFDNFNLETSHVLPAMMRKFHLAKMALEKRLDIIKKDQAIFGKIPDDILDAVGVQSDGSDIRLTNEPAVKLWGTGEPRREFIYVDDMVDACLHIFNQDREKFESIGLSMGNLLFNIGFGKDLKISELAKVIAETVEYDGNILWDTDKPDGTPRKLLDVSRLRALGWESKISFREGIRRTYEWYLKQIQ